jgi:small redox-active disulfide protein 2
MQEEMRMITVKVLGSGCANCKRLEQIAHKVIQNLAIEAEIIKVTDFQEIMDHGVLNTPGLVVNDEVVSSGRIPSESEITTWVVNALETG